MTIATMESMSLFLTCSTAEDEAVSLLVRLPLLLFQCELTETHDSLFLQRGS